MTETIEATEERWPLRPWLLAALGAASGLAIHLILGKDYLFRLASSFEIAVAAFIGSLALLIGFTLERTRWQWALIFSGICALVIALVFYWNGGPDDWRSAENWRAVCGLLAVAIAAPLFQAARDAGERRFAYGAVHDHAWTNVVMWFAAWAFVAIVFGLAYLLSALFFLIKIALLKDALDQQWFWMTLAGAALGAAIGVFRERDRIVRLLFTVAVAVLSVLAPVLGAGLVLFLASLPFTGLAPLWDATTSTTPILLFCTIGALILANAVIGRSDAEEKTFPPLRCGALALAVSMLPLAMIAAVSTGTRIAQYGYTPDRLWAVVFVIVALAYGAAYLAAVLRHRLAWTAAARRINLGLGFGLCGLALFLALPLLSFNAIATRDQVARLESGRISVEKFDWAALRFDFGDPGKAAAARLAKSGSAAIRTAAAEAMKLSSRWDLVQNLAGAALEARIRIYPEGTILPSALLMALKSERVCESGGVCAIRLMPAGNEAVVSWCGASGDTQCFPEARLLSQREGQWRSAETDPQLIDYLDGGEEIIAAGKFEMREVKRRQIFIGDAAVGDAFK